MPTKTNSKELKTFINRCLRGILKIRWSEVISNERLWEKMGQTKREAEIKTRKWRWVGHTPQAKIQRHQVGLAMESTRKAEDRTTKADLVQECWHWGEDYRDDIGRNWEYRQESCALKEFRCGPMFRRESRGINQHVQANILHVEKNKWIRVISFSLASEIFGPAIHKTGWFLHFCAWIWGELTFFVLL